jgi:hypothetical protein
MSDKWLKGKMFLFLFLKSNFNSYFFNENLLELVDLLVLVFINKRNTKDAFLYSLSHR